LQFGGDFDAVVELMGGKVWLKQTNGNPGSSLTEPSIKREIGRRQLLKIGAGSAVSILTGRSIAVTGRISKGNPEHSADIRWTFHADNPVIKPGQLNPGLDDRRAGAAHVVEVDGKYRMYYWGAGQKGNVICVADSPVDKPNQWKGLGHVLESQPDTEYNARGPSFPNVVRLDKKHWLMYLCSWGRADRPIPNRTCLARSFDGGLTWKYYKDNPIIPLDKEYDSYGTGSCWVVNAGREYRMYYTAISKFFDKPEGVRTGHGDRIPLIGIGYMVSKDGMAWHKPLDRFLIAPRLDKTEPYNYIVSKPCVVKEPGGWRMWVSTMGHAYRIRSLVSRDGLEWRWIESGVEGDFGIGVEGEFDDHQRCYAAVVQHGEEYRCWYTGNRFGLAGMGYAAGARQRVLRRFYIFTHTN
jgi:hypothetical protein